MMWIGDGICGVCLSAIDDQVEREAVRSKLLKTNREILYLY